LRGIRPGVQVVGLRDLEPLQVTLDKITVQFEPPSC
jgi:hypothetical protein